MTELSTEDASATRLSCHAVENVILGIWAGHFGRDVSPRDDFYELGGDSLAMMDIVGRARDLGLPVRSSVALRNPTPARLAEALTLGAGGGPVPVPALCAAPGAVVPAVLAEPVVATGAGTPLFVVHSDSHVDAERDAVAAWDAPGPVTGLTVRAGTVAERVELLLAVLRRARPDGPYLVAGFGTGAVVAFELAHRLRRLGAEVPLLALITPPVAGVPGTATRTALLERRLTALALRFGLSGVEGVEEVHAVMRRDGWYGHLDPHELPASIASTVDVELAAREHEPAPYDGPVLLVTDGTDTSAWERAVPAPAVHVLDHGVESPSAVLHDADLAPIMRKALQR